ncbi:MAG: sigma-70 family RNA polymerase sigma factor [Planctomycetes bacterium]|nr:sigma-70 family RNA polymerase sigma factor [Planctomycetota bacterium]
MTNWDQIVDEHGPLVLRLTRRILGPATDAEDVAQEVFLEVFQLSRRQDIRNWAGLFRRVATHRALDRLRRRRKTETLHNLDIPDGSDGPLKTAVAGELAERLRKAIKELSDRQAEVFSLRYFDNRSYDQIAEILGIKPSAVSTALHKARVRLQSLLEIEVKGAQ